MVISFFKITEYFITLANIQSDYYERVEIYNQRGGL